MQDIKDKLAEFVSQLTDEEIEEQLENIFQWAQIYQNMLEKEQKTRSHMEYSSGFVTAEPDVLEDYQETGSRTGMKPDVDYYYAQAIQEKLSRMSENDIQSSLDRLKGIEVSHLTDEEKELLKFEIDACELYYQTRCRGKSAVSAMWQSTAFKCKILHKMWDENYK